MPYLTHLMSVSALVLEYGGGEDAAIGGLLRDAVEDSRDGTEMEARIRREFGDRVAEIVMGCSDARAVPGQAKPPWRDRKAEYLQRLAADEDVDVLLVSACDKLHNLRSILADLRTIGPALWGSLQRERPRCPALVLPISGCLLPRQGPRCVVGGAGPGGRRREGHGGAIRTYRRGKANEFARRCAMTVETSERSWHADPWRRCSRATGRQFGFATPP